MIAVVALGLAMIVVACLAGRLVMRLAPGWATPSRAARWVIGAALVAVTTGVLDAAGVRWLERVSVPLDLAASGPAGAVAALGLALAATMVVGLALLAWPSRPERRAVLLLGVAADGSALEGVRRPLRWGVMALVLAGLTALVALERGEVAWAAAMTTLVGLALGLAPVPAAVASTPSAPAMATTPLDSGAAREAFHRALGDPPLFEHEAAVPASDAFVDAIVAADAPLLAVVAPEGAGKLRAARRLEALDAERGCVCLWISDDRDLGAHTLSVAALVAELQRGASFARVARVVIDARVALSGEALAHLRYGLFRLGARVAQAPTLMVLGGPPAVAIARTIGAAEPRVVTPTAPLPTRAVERYLLEGVPDAKRVATLPADVILVALDRPRAPARHPFTPGAGEVAREYLVPSGGPLGRRLREDRGRSLVGTWEPRLAVALPGDRAAPEAQRRLARFHLRAALAEGPQDPERLVEVFSAPLVKAELAALERAGLLEERVGWVPEPGGAMRARRRLAARLGPSDLDAPETVTLVEPRSARRLEVSRARFDFDHFDGAIVALDAGPAAERCEVRRNGPDAVLVPTSLARAAPLRTLTIEAIGPARRTRLRYRGTRELEVHEVALEVRALHAGVRQFAGGTSEMRAVSRLLPEPIALSPLATDGRLLFFDEPDALAPPALHALTHALREVVPCLFVNAADLGVTWTALPRPAIALFDAHPDGLGAVADLSDDDLEAWLAAAAELLRCTCAASCAACCESTSCTDGSVALDRHGALRALEALLVPRPVRLATALQAVDPASARLRRTG